MVYGQLMGCIFMGRPIGLLVLLQTPNREPAVLLPHKNHGDLICVIRDKNCLKFDMTVNL